jgi:Ca-activated chloride channel family protein
MRGQTIEKLKAVVTALIEGLEDGDRLEMIAFASRQQRYRRQPVPPTADEKRRACDWVEALAAGGGTEMIPAIAEALRPLRPSVPRQVVLVTDGLIGFEADAVRAIRDGLPPGSRLHTVGVGSATNREFLRPAARAGRGVEVIVDLHEVTADAALRLAAATREPLVVELTIEGSALVDAGP